MRGAECERIVVSVLQVLGEPSTAVEPSNGSLYRVRPSGQTRSSHSFDPLVDVLILELCRDEIAACGMQTLIVVHDVRGRSAGLRSGICVRRWRDVPRSTKSRRRHVRGTQIAKIRATSPRYLLMPRYADGRCKTALAKGVPEKRTQAVTCISQYAPEAYADSFPRSISSMASQACSGTSADPLEPPLLPCQQEHSTLWQKQAQAQPLRILTQAAHLFRSEAAQRSDLIAPTIPISSRPPF